MKKRSRVYFSRFAEKQYTKLPEEIRLKLLGWKNEVQNQGIDFVRTIHGYRDKPLLGDRFGQRSIRLNRSYRAFYIETEDAELILICIIEVNKHEY